MIPHRISMCPKSWSARLSCWRSALAPPLGSAIDPSGERGSGLPPSCDYNLDKYEKITPAMVHYRQKAVIPVGMEEVRGVAIGAEDRILVAGDKALQVFASDGKKLKEIALGAGAVLSGGGQCRTCLSRPALPGHEGSRGGLRRPGPSPGRLEPARRARRADLDCPVGRGRVCRRCRFVGRLALRSGRQSGRTDRQARPVAGNLRIGLSESLLRRGRGARRTVARGQPRQASRRSLHLRWPPRAFVGQGRHGDRGYLRLLRPVEYRHFARRAGRDRRKRHSPREGLQRRRASSSASWPDRRFWPPT